MPDTNSWIITAIEKTAMERARNEIERGGFKNVRFMGYSQEQLTVIVCNAIRKHNIDSSMSPAELNKRLA